MLVLWVCECLVGLVLGQRFKVLVLAPAVLLSVVISVSVAIANGDTLLNSAGDAMIAIACLQIGYFLGVSVRHLLVAPHASRLGESPFEVSLPGRPLPR
jgi:hypothetical protein